MNGMTTELPDWMKQGPSLTPGKRKIKIGNREIEADNFQPITAMDEFFVELLGEEPFFAAMSMQMPKIITRSIKTMGVTFFDGMFQMLINPDFVGRLKSAGRKKSVHAVLRHEFYHIALGHVTFRRKQPHDLWNIATDLAINSILWHSHKLPLPGPCYIPGMRPGDVLDNKADPYTAEQLIKLASPPDKFDAMITGFAHMQAADFYFNELSKVWKDKKGKGKGQKGDGQGEGSGSGGESDPDGELSDDHGMWDGDGSPQSEEEREYAAEKARQMVQKAQRQADAKANGWGSIPAEIRQRIRDWVNGTIDWTEELREWTGSQYQANDKYATRRRLNRKYGTMFPGVKRGRGIKAVIFIDQSGSVDDKSLAALCGELRGMGEVIGLTVVPFDCTVDEKNVTEWTAGDTVQFDRTRSGGTNFQAATDFVNDPKNDGRWDVMYIFTDGEAPAPGQAKIPRCWVICPNREPIFKTEEKVIRMRSTS